MQVRSIFVCLLCLVGGQTSTDPAIGLPYGPTSQTWGDGTHDGVVGVPRSITITAYSREGKRFYVGGGSFSLHYSYAGGQGEGTVTDLGSGLYVATYSCNVAGEVTVQVLDADGNHVGQSPFVVHLSAGELSPTTSIATGSLVSGGPKGQLAADVLIHDKYGNAVDGVTVRAVVRDPSGEETHAEVTPTGRGTFVIRYEALRVGQFRVSITANGYDISGSPFSAEVGGGGNDPNILTAISAVVAIFVFVYAYRKCCASPNNKAIAIQDTTDPLQVIPIGTSDDESEGEH